MESQLVLFLALVAVQLICNTVVIILAYKIFAGMATKVADSVSQVPKNASLREWITTLHSASEQAVEVTRAVKEQMTEWEPALERMQAAHASSLAKADVRIGLAFRAVRATVGAVDQAVTWPLRYANTASVIVRGVVDFIRGSKNGDGARPRHS